MRNAVTLILAVLAAGCTTLAEIAVGTIQPAALGVYPLCNGPELAGLVVTTTGAGNWKLSIPPGACKDWT